MPKINRLPDGTYETRISVIDPRTGKRHQPRIRARSKRELDNAIARARAEILERGRVEPNRTPIRDWLDTWLASYHPRSASTYQSRADAVEKIKTDPIADVLLGRVQPIDIQAYVNRLSATLEPSSVRGRYAPLQMALQSAHDLRVIPESPVRGVVLPPRISEPRQTWDAAQVRQFIAATTIHPLGSAFVLAVVLGVRMGELTAFRRSDLEWHRGVLRGCTISRTLSRQTGGGMRVADVPKSSAGHRRLLLPQQCVDAIERRLDVLEPLRDALGDLWDDDDALWGRDDGSHWQSNSTLTRAYDEIVEHAGLPRIRPHDLRHTAATNMIWAGIPLPTVSKILGHATPAVTLSTYAHVIATMEGQAVQAIEAFYGASVPETGQQKRDRLRLIG